MTDADEDTNVTNRQGGEGTNTAPSDDYWPSGCGCIILSDTHTVLHSLFTATTLADAGYDVTLYTHNDEVSNCSDYDATATEQLYARNDTVVWQPDAQATDTQYRQHASLSYSRLYNLLQHSQSGVTLKQYTLTNVDRPPWYKHMLLDYNTTDHTYRTLNIQLNQLTRYLQQRLISSGGRVVNKAVLPKVGDVTEIKSLLSSHDSIIVDCRLKHTWMSNTTKSVDAHVTIKPHSNIITMHQHIDKHNDPLIYVCNHPVDPSDAGVIATSYGCARDVLSVVQKAHRIISSL